MFDLCGTTKTYSEKVRERLCSDVREATNHLTTDEVVAIVIDVFNDYNYNLENQGRRKAKMDEEMWNTHREGVYNSPEYVKGLDEVREAIFNLYRVSDKAHASLEDEIELDVRECLRKVV